MNRKVLLSVNSSEGVGSGESGRMFGFCFISRKDGHCFLEAALGSRRGEWERFISFCQSSIIQLEYLKSIHFLQSFQGPRLKKKKKTLKKLSVQHSSVVMRLKGQG